MDARGRRRLTTEGQKLLGYVTRQDPRPGDNLHLTLDIDLEAAAAKAMPHYLMYGATDDIYLYAIAATLERSSVGGMDIGLERERTMAATVTYAPVTQGWLRPRLALA